MAGKDARSNYSQPASFVVEEAFKGVTAGATILIGPGNGDCANLFTPGARYLVFASESATSRLPEASKGSGSLPVSEGRAIIRWLHGRAATNWKPSLLGMVSDVDSATMGRPFKPLAGAEIRVTANGMTVAAFSDAGGVYELAGLPPGEYELRGSFAGHRMYEDSRTVRVGVSCAFADVGMWVDGHVGGIVQKESGIGADGIRVELIPVEPHGWKYLFRQTQTKDGGRFLFRGIPPGQYLVAVNSVVSPTPGQPYPAISSTVTIQRNQEVTGVLVRLGAPLPLRRVALRFVMPDGAAASGTRVWVSDDPGYAASIEVLADAHGQAAYSWVQGVSSMVYAEGPGRNHVARRIVKPAETSLELKLTPRTP